MANEGYLGKHTLSGERASTDDHPVLIHALPLADGLTGILQPGTLMKRVEVKESGTLVGYVFAPLAASDTEAPCAVVDVPCETAHEKSVKCIVHGCAKTRLLKIGTDPAGAVAIEQLRMGGIFAC